jgi:hypothetical protein
MGHAWAKEKIYCAISARHDVSDVLKGHNPKRHEVREGRAVPVVDLLYILVHSTYIGILLGTSIIVVDTSHHSIWTSILMEISRLLQLVACR